MAFYAMSRRKNGAGSQRQMGWVVMESWKVLKSKSGTHKEFGYPLPQILCRNQKDLEAALENSEIHDPVIKNYLEEIEND